MPIPLQCEAMATEIAELVQERFDLREALSSASPGAKARLLRQIRNLTAAIAARRPALDACIASNGGEPTPQPVAVTFSGRLRFQTDRNLSGEPFSADQTLGLLFDADRTQAFLTAFPEIAFDTTAMANQIAGFWQFLFGPNITTIRMLEAGAGSFSKPEGALALPMKLQFDHSRDLPILVEDSQVSITLTTEGPGGQRLDASGNLVLVGRGTFQEGVMGGVGCILTCVGRLTPLP